jgi:hypothetical protein
VSCCIDGLRATTDWIFATRGKGLWNIDLKRFGCGHIDRFLLTLALPLIKAIRPVLHHMPSLFDVFRMVVSRADLVGIGVRKLGADPFRVVANFRQFAHAKEGIVRDGSSGWPRYRGRRPDWCPGSPQPSRTGKAG